MTRIFQVIVILLFAVVMALWLLCFAALLSTFARNNGEWNDVPDHIRSWFKSVRSPNGVPCCDIADGHQTTWDKRPGNNNYWVPIAGEWREVPPEAVVYNAGNPTGESIVWYIQEFHNVYRIRCFVPGGDV